MLSLRFFTCSGCGTVFADIETPPRCCAEAPFEEIDGGTADAAYFMDVTRES